MLPPRWAVPALSTRVAALTAKNPHGRQPQSVGATSLPAGRPARPVAAADVGPLADDRDSDGLHRPGSFPPPVAPLRGGRRDARLRIHANRHGVGLLRLPAGVRAV